MPGPSETQLRLAYSLLKPVVRMAARFGVPVRTLGDLVKLAYFEHLRLEGGHSHAAIAQRMGQTERSMRSLERKLRSDFFAAEAEVGLPRAIEDQVAHRPKKPDVLARALGAWEPEQVELAVAQLLEEGRLAQSDTGELSVSKRYVTLTSESFPERVDALNHHLDALYQAIVHRLIYNERKQTMIKTISFDALPKSLGHFAQQMESRLRNDIAGLEAERQNGSAQRFTLGVTLSPREDGD